MRCGAENSNFDMDFESRDYGRDYANPSILCNPLSHKCFCIKETLEEHLAQERSESERVSTRGRLCLRRQHIEVG